MNILLAYSSSVFNYSKITKTVEYIKNNLADTNTVMLLRIPLSIKHDSDWYQQVLALSLLKIDNTDVLITFNAPACYLNHSKHIIWLQEKPYKIHPLLIEPSIIWASDKSVHKILYSVGLSKSLHKPLPHSKVEWKTINTYIKSI